MIKDLSKNIIDDNIIEKAVSILNNSGVIAFPTETVYGLGCNMFDESAIAKIFDIKGRSFDKPLAAHISDLEQVKLICDNIPDEFYKIAESFLPGPLSIILKKKKTISNLMTANLETIGIRFPDEPVCLKIISGLGFPLAATSANPSGYPSPVSALEVSNQIKNKIDLIIDTGVTKYQKESTIINLSIGIPRIIRFGVITKSEIEDVLGKHIAS